MTSRSGRPIRPTSRVRQILSNSLCVAFDQAQAVVREDEAVLRRCMKEGRSKEATFTALARLQHNKEELRDILEEVEQHVSPEEFEVYCGRFSATEQDCASADQDVHLYAENAEVGKPEPAVAQQDVDNLLHKTQSLQAEIKSIEGELLRSFRAGEKQFSSKHSPPLQPPSSTPRPPGSAGANRVTFDTSGAPSTIAASVPSATVVTEATTIAAPVNLPQTVQDPTAEALQRLAAVLERRPESSGGGGRLPRVEPDVFKGDLTTFPAWWNAFEAMVESRAKTESEKLFYLSKFTQGAAHESIKGFLSLYTDDTAYHRARNVIVGRYGNRLKIAEAFKCKLNKWPQVKDSDGEALQAYADFLWQCHSAMDSLDYLSNLGCQEENLKMAAKLPKTVGERWDRIVDDAVFGEEPDLTDEPTGLVGRFPSYHEFCRFVSREARIMVGTCTKTGSAVASRSKKSATSLQVSTAESEKKPQRSRPEKSSSPRCAECGGPHYVYQCADFLGKPVEYKKAYAVERGLCFGCLRNNHTFRTCRIRNPEIMRDHPVATPPAAKATTLHVAGAEPEGVYSSLIVAVRCSFNENPERSVLVYALLDSQSSGCFMSEELAEQLRVEPPTVQLELTTLGSRRLEQCGALEGLRVRGEDGGEIVDLPRCYTRRRIPGNHQHIPDPELVAKWPHLRDVAPHLRPARPDMGFGLLIGFNCGEALCQEDYRRGVDRRQPFAIKTVLGWAVSGLLVEKRSPRCQCCWGFRTEVREATVEDVKLAFDSGFKEEEAADRRMSLDDARFVKIIDEGLRQDADSHFVTPLPFRVEPVELPDSRPLAFRRLMAVQRRMRRDPEFSRQYAVFMNDVINSGQAQAVRADDATPIGSRWYWCSHAVKHPRKPGKVRGVWDGAAEVQGESINSHLLSGPDQNNNLAGILVQFRQEKVAVTCDIEGMFLQVRVEPRHRQYLRFLWFDGGDPEASIVDYEMTVLPFGATSSPAIAGRVLAETADRYEGQFGRRAAQFVKDNFYVDDGLGCEPDDAAAIALIKNSRGICAAGGFNLRKFASSSRAVMEAVPKEWLMESVKELQIRDEKLPDERILGLLMSLERDVFLYRVRLVVKADSRRGYLSALSSIFDPLGLVSPALLPGRLILQRLCAEKFTWDQAVEAEEKLEWQEWYQQLSALEQLAVPRCYRRSVGLPLARTELHVFSDASTKGYGVCCYLLLTDDVGGCDTTLLMAKSKVAPSKHTTVPRLELQAAVLGVRLGAFLTAELRYPDLVCHYWTDSTVTLGYITNESRRFHVYVANRVRFIREHTDASQWHHVSTDENPADIASRGVTCRDLVNSRLWWRGPVGAMSDSAPMVEIPPLEDDDPEIKRRERAMAAVIQEEPFPSQRLVTRLSRWVRCVAVAACCLRFIQLLRRRAGCEPTETRVELLERGRQWLIADAQRASFPEEMACLSAGANSGTDRDAVRDRKTRLRQGSSLYRLSAYVDVRGVLRVGGRLSLTSWPREMIHPVVLPGAHVVAKLLIRHYHEECGHMGTVTTVNRLRQAGYWLTGGRATVTRVVASCVICKRKRGAVIEQKMADLPPDRMDTSPPFTHVAADMFGPFLVKRGRAVEKWWICLFVCLSSRAVHLEPVNSLDLSGFIQAYRRFVARRGPVRTLRCDRGTNFVGADNEQKAALKELDQKRLGDELSRRSCDLIPFRFNYPKASHMAGSWERMIRTVRSAMWRTLQQHGESLQFDVLNTLAAEAEWLVNSRPLSAVDMRDDTTPVALTPAQLLTMKPEVLAPPPGRFGPEDRYARRRWRLTQHLADQFWRRWLKEYALLQQLRQQWQHARENLQVDDLVIVVDPSMSRGSWPLGRVTAVEPSSDSLVRKATVKTSTGVLQRPVQKLVFLQRKDR